MTIEVDEPGRASRDSSLVGADDLPPFTIEIPLEFDDEADAQLGSSAFANKIEAHLYSPRSIITAKELRNFCFQARYRAPVRFGTYQGRPACLIVLDFAFQKWGSTVSRYKHAEIDVSFEDGKYALADDVDVSDEQERESIVHQPKVLAFEPRLYHGPTASGEGSTTFGVQVPISVPGGFVGVTPGVSKTTPFVKERYEIVHGLLTDEDARIRFSSDENSMTSNGVRADWSTAMIVAYTPGRRFAARVTIKTHIFLRIINPVCGQKDDPVFFDDKFMREQPHVGSTQSGGSKYGVIHGLQDEVLDEIDLKALTRLGSWGGAFSQ